MAATNSEAHFKRAERTNIGGVSVQETTKEWPPCKLSFNSATRRESRILPLSRVAAVYSARPLRPFRNQMPTELHFDARGGGQGVGRGIGGYRYPTSGGR